VKDEDVKYGHVKDAAQDVAEDVAEYVLGALGRSRLVPSAPFEAHANDFFITAPSAF